MRPILILPAVLLLAACGADGSIKKPSEMTPQERCDNAALALALVEANMPEGSKTVERARLNYALICAAPLPRPAE
ncbi:hypothetical protein CNY89_17460 [Amaricoccus sp. HAR-UPW-R2A-40]|nr:hypothetical protein CNY89_17460 [Amaricoccus sp. HAR-UPW-R2A-40]